jgi:hypothetical protein
MDLENLDGPAYLVCNCHRRHFLMVLDGPLATQDEAQAQLEAILPECPTAFIGRVRPVPEIPKPEPLPDNLDHRPFVAISWNSNLRERVSLKVLTRQGLLLSHVELHAQVEMEENPKRHHFTLEILDDDPHWCLQSRPKEKRPDRFASATAPGI